MRIAALMLVVTPALALAQAESAISPRELARPTHVASVRGSAQPGATDLFTASVTLHAIPFVDVDTSWGAAEGLSARAGPRWTLGDRRGPDHRGGESRLSVLAGMRGLYSTASDSFLARGPNLDMVAALDGTWWLEPHFGVNAQLVAGVAYFPTVERSAWVPDVRFAVGVSF